MGPVAMAIVTGSSSGSLIVAVRALISRFRRIRPKISVELDLFVKVGDVHMRVTKGPAISPEAKSSPEEHHGQVVHSRRSSSRVARRAGSAEELRAPDPASTEGS